MSPSGHRVVSFAGEVAGVEWSGESAREIADLALGAWANSDDRLPDVIFRIGTRADTRVLTLFCGRTCLYRGESAGTVAHLLVQGTLDSLIRKTTGGLVLHAAVLGRGKSGLILPGPTGSGKTMLSAWLSSRGLDHLSDEAGYLADDESVMESYARPFCFKGAWAEFLGLGSLDQSRVLQDDLVSLVPPELLGPSPPHTPVIPRLIVFPRFRAHATLELTRLTPARAAIRLIETVANARNLSDHGVERVAALARTVDAYSMTYGGFDPLGPFVKLVEALP